VAAVHTMQSRSLKSPVCTSAQININILAKNGVLQVYFCHCSSARILYLYKNHGEAAGQDCIIHYVTGESNNCI